MSSLRSRLLRSTLVAVVLVGALSAAITFGVARHETEVLLDGQMQRVALIAASGQVGGAAQQLFTPTAPKGYESEDDYVVTIRDPAGQVQYASHPAVVPPDLRTPGFGNVIVAGADYRVFMLPSKERLIVVAQSSEVRREIAVGAALSALLPVVLIIPALGLVIALVVRRQLRDVARGARQIAERPPLSVDPLPVDSLPTEVQPLVEELNKVLERQRVAISLERRFIADAAHALRTPLTALQLQADVLEGSADPDERQRRLAELRAGIRRVGRLSTQLLELARHDAASSGPVERAALGDVLSDLESLYAPIAQERGVRLSVAIPEPQTVSVGAVQLLLVLGNLLDNALRYSPRGAQVVVQTGTARDRVQVLIQDEGPGIPRWILSRVFERFYRVPGDTTEGNGLGLSTVAAVCAQIGASVSLENRVNGAGLVATLSLPVDG